MSLVVLLGGARSGKSRLAVSLAGDEPVTFVATAEARDDEMCERIAAHRNERPAGWQTVEAPLDLAGALASGGTLVIDCLSLWVANLLEAGRSNDDVLVLARAAAGQARDRPARTIAVSNEVGLGVVPATPLGRVYRDVLGTVNRIWADAADEAWFVVAGRRLRLE